MNFDLGGTHYLQIQNIHFVFLLILLLLSGNIHLLLEIELKLNLVDQFWFYSQD